MITISIDSIMGIKKYNHGASYASIIRLALRIIVLAVICTGTSILVGSRGIDVGTDTSSYIQVFKWSKEAFPYFEPGFSVVTYGLAQLGLGQAGYLTGLYLVLLATVLVSTRKYWQYLGREQDYLVFLAASLMMLFLSPMFTTASINILRQGLSALLVFTALLSFHQRQWWQFVFFGIVAASFHYSALNYLFFAPVLLLGRRMVWPVAIVSAVLYLSGLSEIMVKIAVPSAYTFLINYGNYEGGIELKDALFSLFCLAIPFLLSDLTYSPYNQRIKSSGAVFLVMLLPFFAVGWGGYPTRYLFTAWLSLSLIVAAIICNSRVTLLRTYLFNGVGLIVSSAVFYIYIEYLGWYSGGK